MSLELKLAYNELNDVKILFNEYTTMLGLDLNFQNYADELENLPGKYNIPYGRLYIAVYNDNLAGCVGLRPLKENVCEMKRLFVKPQFRGYKIGKALTERVITDAQNIGYKYMVLDTIPILKNAIDLYKSIGFYEIEPYYFNPVEGALFLQLDL